MDSILTSIKKLLGVSEEYTDFDPDITMHINSVFMILTQMGVGPNTGFRIEDETSKWTDFMADELKLEGVKSYIHLKVKLLFDPPLSGAVRESTEQLIKELEWRLYTGAESEV